MEMQHLCRVDPGRSDTQVAARPKLQCDPGYAQPRSCATWAALDLGRARTPVSGFFFFFSFFSDEHIFSFAVVISLGFFILLVWFSFAVVAADLFVFYFSCKSSLRDSISM